MILGIVIGLVVGIVLTAGLVGLGGANPVSELEDERFIRKCFETEVHRLKAEAAQRGEVR